ncbi:hypothetical protein OPT61_g4177 [Boeremia exigua]|uniref:Uncharacterized protein n=1 Tax=Boeremia exigua TaxID=749465 RepID=A0ACC2IEZ1_9PLEO|nr:hypothetical protein OPT61_g4177 [Boeremia exigua]
MTFILIPDYEGNSRTDPPLLDRLSLFEPRQLERILINSADNLTPSTSDLGAKFGALPIELQHHVLLQLDLASLLKFRQVNKLAMRVADSMAEFEKIMKHSSTKNAIRMAVVLNCGYRFTVAQLFDKLCQAACDTCGSLAAYIDVFSCTRQCLNVGGNCQPRHLPQSLADMIRIYKLNGAQLAQLVTAGGFQQIPGDYGFGEEVQGYDTLYDGEAAAKMSPSVSAPLEHYDKLSKLTVVRALHLNHDDSHTRDVDLCDDCIKMSRLSFSFTGYARDEDMRLANAADLADVALCFSGDMEAHRADAHPELRE